MVAHLLGQIPAECETPAADLVRGWTAAKVRAHLSQFNLAWNEFSRRGPFWEE
jgi:hypothetical protein